MLGLLGMVRGVPHAIWGDGTSRYIELVELLDQGRLSDDSYSMIGPLVALPLWYAGKVAGGPAAWLVYFNLILFALALAACYGLLHNRMDRALLRRFLLLLTAGTLVAAHVTGFYGEMFTAACVAVGVLAALARPGRLAGWAAVVIGAANTPASFLALGLVSVERTVVRRRLRYLGIALAGAVLVMGEAWLRRGGPFVTGHEGPTALPKTVLPYSGQAGFSYPLLLGVLAILFSFGRGLVFFIPGLLLPLRRRLAELHDPARIDLFRAYMLWMLFLAGLAIVYGSWWAWHGSVYWGPRFFLIGIFPASLALAVALTYRHASALADLGTLAVLGLSVWVAASSSVFYGTMPLPFCHDPVMEQFCYYVPEYSQLWYPFVVKPHLGTQQIVYLGYFTVVFCWLAAPVVVRLIGKIAARRATWELPFPGELAALTRPC